MPRSFVPASCLPSGNARHVLMAGRRPAQSTWRGRPRTRSDVQLRQARADPPDHRRLFAPEPGATRFGRLGLACPVANQPGAPAPQVPAPCCPRIELLRRDDRQLASSGQPPNGEISVAETYARAAVRVASAPFDGKNLRKPNRETRSYAKTGDCTRRSVILSFFLFSQMATIPQWS